MIKLTEHFRAVAALRDAILTESRNNPRVIETRFGPAVDRLTAMVKAAPLSNTYRTQQKRVVATFLERLKAMPDYEVAVRHWPSLSRAEQTMFLKRCMATLADIQETASGVRVKPARLEWTDRHNGVSGQAYYSMYDKNGNADRIVLTATSSNGNRSMADALNTLVHEQTHIFQASLARAAHYGAIKKDHPLHADGMLLATKALGDAYVPWSIPQAYRQQCDEVDAFSAGDSVGAFVAGEERRLRPASRFARSAPAGPSASLPFELVFGLASLGLNVLGTGAPPKPHWQPAPLPA